MFSSVITPLAPLESDWSYLYTVPDGPVPIDLAPVSANDTFGSERGPDSSETLHESTDGVSAGSFDVNVP
jgi:hypothetical protein